MRIGRLLVGAAVILFALWIVIGEQITGVSSDAVVNARLSTVRAPIAGTLDMPIKPFGANIAEGEQLATMTDPLADTIRLNDLAMERSFFAAEVARIEGLLGILDADILSLRTRGEVYTASRATEVDARIRRAGERVALLGAPEMVDAPAAANNLTLSRALEELETLRIARQAITDGVFLGDGYNDTPVSGRQLMDISVQRDSLGLQLTAARDRLAAVVTRHEAEAARVALLSRATLTAPSEGILWEALAGDGEVVQRGQDVLKLMICDSALVTLSVPGNVYNRLSVGQHAKFRLDGSQVLYDGTISRIAGSGAETIYRNLAVAPSIKHLERFDIALLVPALRDTDGLRCTVGQTGRVFFESRPLDWLRGSSN